MARRLSSETELVPLSFDKQGERRVSSSHEERRFQFVTQCASGSCSCIEQFEEYRQQFGRLVDRLGKWVMQRRQSVEAALLTKRGDGLQLIVMQRSEALDEQLEQELADLKTEFVCDRSFDRVTPDVLLLPPISPESIRGYLCQFALVFGRLRTRPGVRVRRALKHVVLLAVAIAIVLWAWDIRYRSSAGCIAVLKQAGHVTYLGFTDEMSLAVGSAGEFAVWDAEFRAKEPILSFDGSSKRIAVASSGELIATGNQYGWLQVWSTSSRKPIAQGLAHGGSIEAVAFSPDGLHLATGGFDKVVRIVDAKTLTLVEKLNTGAIVQCLQFAPDGKSLAIGLNDEGEWGHVFVWEIATGQKTSVSKQVFDPEALAYSQDGRKLAVGRAEVMVFDRTRGEPAEEAVYSMQHGKVLGVTFSPNGRYLAYCRGAVSGSSIEPLGHVVLVDLLTGVQVSRSHSGRVSAVAFSRDASLLASGTWSGDVKIWSVPSLLNSGPNRKR